jgi:hypothetical protein
MKIKCSAIFKEGMTTICRIPLPIGCQIMPVIQCDVEDGFMVIKTPEDLKIIDSNELCQYLRCRHIVTKGRGGKMLKYCEEHAEYMRVMQKKRYRELRLKTVDGICAHPGCTEQRSQMKNRSHTLGLYCTEHADKRNQSAMHTYKRKRARQVASLLQASG